MGSSQVRQFFYNMNFGIEGDVKARRLRLLGQHQFIFPHLVLTYTTTTSAGTDRQTGAAGMLTRQKPDEMNTSLFAGCLPAVGSAFHRHLHNSCLKKDRLIEAFTPPHFGLPGFTCRSPDSAQHPHLSWKKAHTAFR